MAKRRKRNVLVLVAIIVGMSLCLNEAVYGDHLLGVKIVYGVVALALYVGIFLFPYFLRKPKHPEQTFKSYIKEEVKELICH